MVVTAVVPPGDIGTLIENSFQTFLALVLAIVSLFGIILKFVLSRSHPGRLQALELKAEAADKSIEDMGADIQKNEDKIHQIITVGVSTIPAASQAAQANAAKIAAINKQMADLTTQLKTLQGVTETVTGTTGSTASPPTTAAVAPAEKTEEKKP